MNSSTALEIGARWTATRPSTTQIRWLGPVSVPLDLGTLSIAESSRLGTDAAREHLDAVSDGLRSAFGAFTSHSRPKFTTTVDQRPATQAAFAGTVARMTPIIGSYSVVQSTVRVNTQTSTVRSSSTSIGFDLTAAHSRLSSNPLSLDVTSAERASTLTSTSAVGLNVVDAASTIASTSEMNVASATLGSSNLAISGSTSRLEISGA